jgi:hypothetical protein
MKPIKQSVINTFNRVNINHELMLQISGTRTATNRFTGDSVETTPLIAACIRWVYKTSNAYEYGDFSVKTSDFDRIRYFVLEQDSKAYNVCLD